MIFRFTISLALFFFLHFLCNQYHATEAAPNYLEHYCPNSTLFAPNSTYQSNLNTLLSSLSSAAGSDADGFADATAGKEAPDRAYGLFLCRGDVSTTTCSECVATGMRDILERCPDRRVSVIWYDECMLKYSDRPMVVELVPGYSMPYTGNAAEPDRFMQLLGETMKSVAGRASGSESGKKFAAAEANLTSSQKLYTLAQCTPDSAGSGCNTCLQAVIASLPQGERSGRSFTPSCMVRFEMYLFYNASAVPPQPQLPSPPPAPSKRAKGKSNNSTTIIIAVAIPVGVGVGVAVTFLFFACCSPWSKTTKTYEVDQAEGTSEISTAESLQYNLAIIQAATSNFSHRNKLGQGGFGEVFQGRLPNGQEIAVKRLSKSSGQGVGEFKNEVVLVAKLEHRNLVRLLGFCLEGEEKILVYEFVPNKSLDYFLFDPDKRRQLDWSRRYKIISGIARGMLYLHEDSRFRIIHRDLKPGNVLLDSDMNPKISDFGMARIFGVDQTRAKTNKIVGTYGYLSPEYAMRGQISTKSDVYSLGVLILEIISGKKNNSFLQSEGGENLTSYAWKQWRAGTPLEVLDPFICNSYSIREVLRCLHIGLLSVQEDPADRPTMASIVIMLGSHSVKLPKPREPAFFLQKSTERQLKELESDESTSRSIPWSANEMSVTELYPR